MKQNRLPSKLSKKPKNEQEKVYKNINNSWMTVFRYCYNKFEYKVRFVGDNVFYKGMTWQDFRRLWWGRREVVEHLYSEMQKYNKELVEEF